MKVAKVETIQAVIDVGTSVLRVSIAQKKGREPLKILATTSVKNKYCQRGIVTDVMAMSGIVKTAIEDVERQSGMQIRSVNVAIGGGHIFGSNVSYKDDVKSNFIERSAIERAIKLAKESGEEDGYLIMHALLQGFTVDEHQGIISPEEMIADSFEARMHLIKAKSNDINNIRRSIELADIEVNRIIYSGLASAYAAATDIEKELGACVVDIGAGVTDIVVYKNNEIIFTAGINAGGESISSMIAAKLVTPRLFAESIKIDEGTLRSGIDYNGKVRIPSTGLSSPSAVNKADIIQVIFQGYKQLFHAICDLLNESGIKSIGVSGFLLTGGGSRISYLSDFVKKNIKTPARIAAPETIEGLPDDLQNRPEMMTTIGLFKLIYEPMDDRFWEYGEKKGIMRRLISKLRHDAWGKQYDF